MKKNAIFILLLLTSQVFCQFVMPSVKFGFGTSRFEETKSFNFSFLTGPAIIAPYTEMYFVPQIGVQHTKDRSGCPTLFQGGFTFHPPLIGDGIGTSLGVQGLSGGGSTGGRINLNISLADLLGVDIAYQKVTVPEFQLMVTTDIGLGLWAIACSASHSQHPRWESLKLLQHVNNKSH